MGMTSSRPYMVRALYDWIVDNGCTPYLLVDAHASDVEVPQQYVNKDGQIVLNIAPTAVVDLSIENAAVSFNARFGGIPTNIYVPCSGILGVYARENGQGMIFEPEVDVDPEPPKPSKPRAVEKAAPKPASQRPSLKVVK
jgi:stringent starvation protein B